jgi:hypothetical protein
VLQAKERAPTPPFVIFTFGLAIESIKELGGALVLECEKSKSIKNLTQSKGHHIKE